MMHIKAIMLGFIVKLIHFFMHLGLYIYTRRQPLIDTRMHTHTLFLFFFLKFFYTFFFFNECEMIIWTISLLCIDYLVLLAPILGLTILFLDVGDFL